MISRLDKIFNARWQRFAHQRTKPGHLSQALGDRNLYIMPSVFGWVYALMLVSLFTGAINYQISAVFLMTFLMAILGLLSAWDAHRNLKDLQLHCLPVEDVEAGSALKVLLWIANPKEVRYSLQFKWGSETVTRCEVIPKVGLQIELPVPTATRGFFQLPVLTISSYYPLGLFRVWGYARFNESYYVYPAPQSPGFWPEQVSSSLDTRQTQTGDEEFYELKEVADPWHQSNRIAWKIAARGQGWYLKSMVSPTGNYWLFRLQDLPDTNKELCLQQLSYWLQTAELQGLRYGLELHLNSPSPLTRGKTHLHYCLRQLALY